MKKTILLGSILVLAFSCLAGTKKQKSKQPIDVLLLLALPASGKSEVRRYLSGLDHKECKREFGIKETVQMDDFPYVHIMRVVSDELCKRGKEGAFFISPALPFRDSRDWGTLVHLMNADYDDLVHGRTHQPESVAEWVFDRIDVARKSVGAAPVFKQMASKLRKDLAQALESDAKKLLDEKNKEVKKGCKNKTVVIEFARGGADASPMPLPQPYGYQYALSNFSPAILEKSSILYIWVDPSESRRKNLARANPNDPGSILNHCVPQAVMYADYGCDDIAHMLAKSDIANTVRIDAHGSTYHIPVGRFDNRTDKTTFVHKNRSTWKAQEVSNLRLALKDAFTDLEVGRAACSHLV